MTDQVAHFLSISESLLAESELIEIATDLTAIPSYTGDETALALHVRDVLRNNGIEANEQWVAAAAQPGGPDRYQTIGRIGGAGKPALLFNGHLDMDPVDDRPDRFTARRHGDKLYGAGLHNMKSGLAAMIGAAIMVQRSGIRLARPLRLEFVAGELQGGVGTKRALSEALGKGLLADAAVVPEPYSVRHILTRTAGVHKFALVVRGKTAHTSRHREGVDAIAVLRALMDLLDRTDLGLGDPKYPELPRLQLSSLVAGRGDRHDPSGVSYSADKATAIYDLRYPPPYEPELVVEVLEAFVRTAARLFPEARISVDQPPDPVFRVGGAEMPPMDVSPDSELVKDISALLPQVSSFSVKETGLVLPYSYCGNDTTHLSRAGIQCCLFGPRGEGPDTEDHVLVSEMLACARTLAALAVLRCGGPRFSNPAAGSAPRPARAAVAAAAQ
ncbi:M20 family metallopeptidase [Nocardia huaxiensis]|uniref:M20 family metallopeptidase n=1 Tax=Nocardia huaxiensis TaxID=2755382 RepID=A0A7D6Z3U9_9NOCA|nr:M20 family metallopeptidase [Nocardia huaxiensis]QLY32206.1 M20 family metallopeptidase [Nocardia huaxiensis]UFS94091.1 M20 family metallopeptidase [Nocardia huaxiensis]